MITDILEKHMTAVAFAESGEFDTALKILNPSISNEKSIEKGAVKMNHETVKNKTSKYILPALGYGLVSLSLYAALLMNEQQVTDTFTMGGWYAILPVGSAFLFSFIHGAFASNLLSALGIEAKK